VNLPILPLSLDVPIYVLTYINDRYIQIGMLQEPGYLILSALAHGPAHGYAIMQTVEELSGGRVTIRAGTLYTALDRFLHSGWIAIEDEELVEGRLRRTYVLTDVGADILAEEVKQLSLNVKIAQRGLAARIRPGQA
jgi:DNA-binding PadR family transcriptional regulator